MSTTETSMRKKTAPLAGFIAMFTPRKNQRHALPAWAAQAVAARRPS